MSVDRRPVKISFVIPSFNRGAVLCRTIEMLLEQTTCHHEIIVIDQSQKVLREIFAQLDDWKSSRAIQWIRQDVPNASRARNAGALASTGDVIVFLDDDIKVPPDFVDRYMHAFADESVRCVTGQVLEGAGETVSTMDACAFDPEIGWLYFKRHYDKPFEGSFLMAGNMGVRREDFFAIGGMDERYFRGAFREEADFAMRWRKSGRTIHFRPEVSLYHLGGAGVVDGGARHWTRKTLWVGWHHYFGSWYFMFNHATWRTLPHLFAIDIRSAGVNKKTMRKPWMVPVHLCRWLSALPYALWCRMKGPKLLPTQAAFNPVLSETP